MRHCKQHFSITLPTTKDSKHAAILICLNWTVWRCSFNETYFNFQIVSFKVDLSGLVTSFSAESCVFHPKMRKRKLPDLSKVGLGFWAQPLSVKIRKDLFLGLMGNWGWGKFIEVRYGPPGIGNAIVGWCSDILYVTWVTSGAHTMSNSYPNVWDLLLTLHRHPCKDPPL